MDHHAHAFQGQLKYEELQFFFRRHWVRFLRPVFFGGLVGLLIIAFLIPIGILIFGHASPDIATLRTFYAFLVMLITIGYIHIFYISVINYFFDLVIVTDNRIIVIRKTVFLRNDSDAIDLTKIQDIGVESHGIFRNYLKYGELLITISTSSPQMIIDCVPDPHLYLERTNRIKREHILKRQERKGHPGEPHDRTADYLQDVRQLI